MEPSALLARLDAALAELQALREALAASLPPPAENGADDLAEANLLDTFAASARFGYPADTVRKWCRTEDLGVMRGGRWLVSIPRLQRRINGK